MIDEPAVRIAGSIGNIYDPAVFGARFFFTADEVQEGRDLNGDGDTLDTRVAHMFNGRDRTLTNFELALDRLRGIDLFGNLAVFNVNEHDQGKDLDADGLLLSRRVPHIYDIGSGTIANVGIPALSGTSRVGNVLQFQLDVDGLFVFDLAIEASSIWDSTEKSSRIEGT